MQGVLSWHVIWDVKPMHSTIVKSLGFPFPCRLRSCFFSSVRRLSWVVAALFLLIVSIARFIRYTEAEECFYLVTQGLDLFIRKSWRPLWLQIWPNHFALLILLSPSPAQSRCSCSTMVHLQVEGFDQNHEHQDSLASPSHTISNFVTVSILHPNSWGWEFILMIISLFDSNVLSPLGIPPATFRSRILCSNIILFYLILGQSRSKSKRYCRLSPTLCIWFLLGFLMLHNAPALPIFLRLGFWIALGLEIIP